MGGWLVPSCHLPKPVCLSLTGWVVVYVGPSHEFPDPSVHLIPILLSQPLCTRCLFTGPANLDQELYLFTGLARSSSDMLKYQLGHE